MKSIVRVGYGPPEILSIQEISRPSPNHHQILIRVHAATVNRTDCGALWGEPFIVRFFVGFPRPRHFATGSDFAGTVVALGKDVSKFKLGDRVFGFNDHGAGSHAEYMVIAEDQPIRIIPTNTTFEQAAASIGGSHYAYNFISKVTLKPGDCVLVNGANTQGDFTKQNLEHYDFVFDAVGKSRFSLCKPLLKPNGIYISSELGPYAENLFLALLTPLPMGKKLILPVPTDIKRTLNLVCSLLESGELTPLIDREFSLHRIAMCEADRKSAMFY